ncbi:MAG: DUF4276 family protein [Bacteroidales bacterium]|nr:DUF4276 family protein [Bacteroidales bacterium]
MLDRIEILVEEPSIAEVLRVLLPNILPNGWKLDENCFIRPHEGKQDLQRSLPHKISSAGKRDIKIGFIILQDQDSNDCRVLKQKLVDICNKAIPKETIVPYKVRIVCHELESWYLGDMFAIEQTFSRFHAAQYKNKRLFRDPDQCVNPKNELKKIVGDYSQIATAREIASHMIVENNKSHSFICFVNGLLKLIA